ncbi:DUF3954 domain-containing protein [Paenalkalicoccus suaedae]|uniref:DUF3954 domain-containing protein n=1 Tax=Paenalkalicoccus suaedae TaxID=2592382 RepID=A0A859FF00_9BACI|nr:DUF3954 domain-containing protein [Paenalkalicoccus suaedae]QKS71923.1 DUF3954 domain-containing protein [Paenalkalicoccus suaedae]
MVKINKEAWTAEVDLTENAVYIVKDGFIKKVNRPETGFGRHIVSWQKGKPVYAEIQVTEHL